MNSRNTDCFVSSDILLPDFNEVDGKKWAVIACDQFTSEKEYWERASEFVESSPSTLSMMIPEVYLSETKERIPLVHKAMEECFHNVLKEHSNSMIYLERVQSDGRVRHGIIGAVDLEHYDYHKGATSLIRATEGTVLERIPPRVAVRREALLELPHVMLLIDDKERTVIEPLQNDIANFDKAYDFELMLGGGSVKGYFINKEHRDRISDSLKKLALPEVMAQKYGSDDIAPFLFAVGDGNHSLATAKASYEELKAKIGDSAKNSLARYALCEVVNLHDDALDFEPIYRVVFGVDPEDVLEKLRVYAAKLEGGAGEQYIKCISAGFETELCVENPTQQLTVGTLQNFLDEYVKDHPEAEIDYIHGEDSLRALSAREGAIGFLFDGMSKNELFKTVIFDGALPRKTFSMGHARDKRYYLECRKIK